SIVDMLGEERTARTKRSQDGQKKSKSKRLQEFQKALRATQQLALALRSQGLSDQADRFAYRAQGLQREVVRRQGKLGSYLFSVLLAGAGWLRRSPRPPPLPPPPLRP